MDQENQFDNQSVQQVLPPVNSRKLAKVPFVEMADGRLQGVVSSGSDISRVYVSFFKKGSHNFYCSTNNNRPCGGLSGSYPCKHLRSLLDEAVLQYGAEKVIRYLKTDAAPESINKGNELLADMNGDQEKEPAGTVFSRFLKHLSYLELRSSNQPLPEMSWFVASKEEK